MHYRVRGLSPKPFQALFELSDSDLAAHGAARQIADAPDSYPCRVSLEDATPGEELLLVHYGHHDVPSPYRAAGPIYVRRNAQVAFDAVDRIPRQQQRRLLSVRAYDTKSWLVEAEVVPGEQLESLVHRWFGDSAIAYLHVHNARPGCYACLIERA